MKTTPMNCVFFTGASESSLSLKMAAPDVIATAIAYSSAVYLPPTEAAVAAEVRAVAEKAAAA